VKSQIRVIARGNHYK